ncbi:unnamed protein product [Amoebophrya sp. A25]|nr:unnamed protein product [Amoebophrya sp. A25]|eukprot:GSA25T00023469001.1
MVASMSAASAQRGTLGQALALNAKRAVREGVESRDFWNSVVRKTTQLLPTLSPPQISQILASLSVAEGLVAISANSGRIPSSQQRNSGSSTHNLQQLHQHDDAERQAGLQDGVESFQSSSSGTSSSSQLCDLTLFHSCCEALHCHLGKWTGSADDSPSLISSSDAKKLLLAFARLRMVDSALVARLEAHLLQGPLGEWSARDCVHILRAYAQLKLPVIEQSERTPTTTTRQEGSDSARIETPTSHPTGQDDSSDSAAATGTTSVASVAGGLGEKRDNYSTLSATSMRPKSIEKGTSSAICVRAQVLREMCQIIAEDAHELSPPDLTLCLESLFDLGVVDDLACQAVLVESSKRLREFPIKDVLRVIDAWTKLQELSSRAASTGKADAALDSVSGNHSAGNLLLRVEEEVVEGEHEHHDDDDALHTATKTCGGRANEVDKSGSTSLLIPRKSTVDDTLKSFKVKAASVPQKVLDNRSTRRKSTKVETAEFALGGSSLERRGRDTQKPATNDSCSSGDEQVVDETAKKVFSSTTSSGYASSLMHEGLEADESNLPSKNVSVQSAEASLVQHLTSFGLGQLAFHDMVALLRCLQRGQEKFDVLLFHNKLLPRFRAQLRQLQLNAPFRDVALLLESLSRVPAFGARGVELVRDCVDLLASLPTHSRDLASLNVVVLSLYHLRDVLGCDALEHALCRGGSDPRRVFDDGRPVYQQPSEKGGLLDLDRGLLLASSRRSAGVGYELKQIRALDKILELRFIRKSSTSRHCKDHVHGVLSDCAGPRGDTQLEFVNMTQRQKVHSSQTEEAEEYITAEIENYAQRARNFLKGFLMSSGNDKI